MNSNLTLLRFKSILKTFLNLFVKSQKFVFIKLDTLDSFRIYHCEGSIENLYFPAIHGLTIGGEILAITRGIDLYEFHDVEFALNSDFIRFTSRGYFCDKLNRKVSLFGRCGDSDLLSIDSFKSVNLKSYKSKVYFHTVFHLTGCYSGNWSHFLVQYFPSTDLLRRLPTDIPIYIVLPNGLDKHIIEMLKFVVRNFENISIQFIDSKSLVQCSFLYYPLNDTYLGDIGIIPSLFHIQTSDSTVKYVSNTCSLISAGVKSSNISRIFIGRRGKRNITNYQDVLERFQKLGFLEVFPHLLSFEDKVALFKDAKLVAGPASSGFANVLFSRCLEKVLAFVNPSRHDDMYLTKFAKYNKFKLELFLGVETYSCADSDFEINLIELDSYLDSFN